MTCISVNCETYSIYCFTRNLKKEVYSKFFKISIARIPIILLLKKTEILKSVSKAI